MRQCYVLAALERKYSQLVTGFWQTQVGHPDPPGPVQAAIRRQRLTMEDRVVEMPPVKTCDAEILPYTKASAPFTKQRIVSGHPIAPHPHPVVD